MKRKEKTKKSALVDERSQRSLHFPGSFFGMMDGKHTEREEERQEKKEQEKGSGLCGDYVEQTLMH